MSDRRRKIYTGTGDKGETGLFGGGRVPKDHHRVQAYGEVDELNSALGLAATLVEEEETRARLGLLQRDLFALGALLATPEAEEGQRRPHLPAPPFGRIEEMESWIDEAAEALDPLQAFILPGGSPGAAALHVARAVCRRSERSGVALARSEPVEEGVLVYLNRLSDLLFMMARLENRRQGVRDALWEGEDGG